MALSFWAGDRWKLASFARREAGADVYICCPGPSLADVDPAILQVPGAITIAVNSAYPHIARPAFWIGTDHPACFDKALMWEPFPKILRAAWKEQLIFGVPIKACPQTYFADARKDVHPLDMWHNLSDNLCLVTRVWNSFDAALHFALWLGAKRIHLVGCDFGGAKDYYDDRVLTPAQRHSNRHLYQAQVQQLAHHALEGAMNHGVEIVSCTPDSPVNRFLKAMPLAEALKATAARIPQAWTPKPHARDAAMCRWQVPPDDDIGIVVGVIPEQAWMLEWWLANLRKHNPDLPVAFADFGLPQTARDWCDAHGSRFEVRAPESVNGWFRKPFAMLGGPFRKVMWLDLDTEIRGPLLPMFERCRDGLVGACRTDVMTPEGYAEQRDRGWNVMVTDPHYDGGIIIAEHGNPIIEEWALNSIPPWEFTYRGDHEILNVVLRRRGTPSFDLTGSDFSLARLPTDRNATILHHAGIIGKKMVKDRIEGRVSRLSHPQQGFMAPEETARLMSIVVELANLHKEVRILEIGVAKGGTAAAMMRKVVECGSRYKYIGVDAMDAWHPTLFPRNEVQGDIHMVPHRSQDARAKEAVAALAPAGVHLLLVDGCHCAACTQSDWDWYAPMVVAGGYMAFHDTVVPTNNAIPQPGTEHVGNGVRTVYESVKGTAGWADLGEVGAIGLGILRRITPPALSVAASVVPSAAG